ncbi:MAG: translation initiation factor IF-3 [Bacteriovoracia bacterium]
MTPFPSYKPGGPPPPGGPRGPGGGGGSGGGGGRFIKGKGPITPNKDEHRINERIRVPEVRLIDENGGQVGVVPTFEALKMARERGLDLMEISPTSRPPVCKICDYGKFKYEKKKKEQQAKKKQVVIKVKEIQLRPNTDQHDLDYKLKAVRGFLEEGDKAKITMMFRGREVAHSEVGYKIMRDLITTLKDVAIVEFEPKLEGKKMIMILAPASKKPGGAPTPKTVVSPVSPITPKPGVVITPKKA